MKKKNIDLSWINKNFSYIDSLTMIDNRGVIVVKQRFNPRFTDEENRINNEWAVGKNLLEAFPSLSHEDSSLLQALTTGKVICYEAQRVVNREGSASVTNNITLPIITHGNIVGAVELSRDLTHIENAAEPSITGSSKDKNRAKYTLDDIITESPQMLEIKKKIKKIADSPSSVFIYGETGTGKELVVSAIHNASKRKNEPFIALNCAALPENILEGLLFGSQKGAFTGAENKKGMFEEANGGTIYLDEINSMPLFLQSKLLRVLQDKQVTPLGSSKPIDLDVRIIASTNTPINELIKSEQMREDIFYRLSTIRIDIPPLRDRTEDIELLTNHFISKYNEQFGKNIKGISKEALDFLKSHKWPGNIRELEHVIESALNMMADDTVIGIEQMPTYLTNNEKNEKEVISTVMYNSSMPSLTEMTEAYEKKLIYDALAFSNFNVSLAAERLKIPRTSLNYKIKKYDLNKSF